MSQQWEAIGSLDTAGHSKKVSGITGIQRQSLGHRDNIAVASVATKLSWDSRKKSTRIEDKAYPSLGLINVSMPLLYGEGKKAWFRPQQEIARASPDESILA